MRDFRRRRRRRALPLPLPLPLPLGLPTFDTPKTCQRSVRGFACSRHIYYYHCTKDSGAWLLALHRYTLSSINHFSSLAEVHGWVGWDRPLHCGTPSRVLSSHVPTNYVETTYFFLCVSCVVRNSMSTTAQRNTVRANSPLKARVNGTISFFVSHELYSLKCSSRRLLFSWGGGLQQHFRSSSTRMYMEEASHKQ